MNAAARVGPRTGRLPRPTSAVAVAGVGVVAACVAIMAFLLIRYPGSEDDLPPARVVLLAVALAAGLWLMLNPPRWLRGDPLGHGIAVVMAGSVAAGLLLTSRLAPEFGFVLTVVYLYQLAPLVFFFAGAVAAAAGRSLRAGVRTTVWTAVLTALAAFAIGLLEPVTWFQTAGLLILVGDQIPTQTLAESLSMSGWSLLIGPLWWAPFGVIGAGIAARLSRRGSTAPMTITLR
jgi:hypothetical protein